MSTQSADATSTAEPRRGPNWLRVALLLMVWGAAIVVSVLNDQRLAEWWFGLAGGSVPIYMIATILTLFLKIHIIALVLLLISMLDPRVRWNLLKDACWVTAAQALASEILKQTFGRLRPDLCNWHSVFYGPAVSHGRFGFPSGHATASFALAAILTTYYPRWRWVFLVGAAAIALSRVHLGRHFFGDTVAGSGLGWYLAMWILGLLESRRAKKVAATEASVAQAAS